MKKINVADPYGWKEELKKGTIAKTGKACPNCGYELLIHRDLIFETNEDNEVEYAFIEIFCSNPDKKACDFDHFYEVILPLDRFQRVLDPEKLFKV
jgi:hypothetical protein